MSDDRDLWEAAVARLDGETAKSLKSSDSPIAGGVVTVIEDIKKKKIASEAKKQGWNIIIPGIGQESKVVNLRNMVYTIMEAAFEFKDIVDKVLAFDATKYGMCAQLSF